jgi:hypothetical protein
VVPATALDGLRDAMRALLHTGGDHAHT